MKVQNNKIIIVNNVDETIKFANSLAMKVENGDIFCLSGDLGVGKTVIAKSIGKFFNVKDDIISPTFNIVKVYDIEYKKINKLIHFDLYRIKNLSELINIGIEDYIYDDNAVILIEWPEIAKDILPKNAKWINIEKVDGDENKRKITYDI